MSQRQTSAGQWFDARQQGRRLPEHELPEDLHCGLCGQGMYPHEYSQAVRETTNMDICASCLEAMTENACASH